MPGLEVISRYTTNIDSGNLFSTDSNGRGMIQRQRDFRETWTLNLTEPVSANYYPVVSRMAMEEGNSVRVDKKQAWVMTDRAEGGSSLQAGQMELMLHRRLFNDDAFGVGEPLNETAFGRGLVVRGVHKLLLCTEDCEVKNTELTSWADTNFNLHLVLLKGSQQDRGGGPAHETSRLLRRLLRKSSVSGPL